MTSKISSIKLLKDEIKDKNLYCNIEFMLANKKDFIEKFKNSQLVEVKQKELVFNCNGEKCSIRFETAINIDYFDNVIYIYAPIFRDLNIEEKKFINEWEEYVKINNIKDEIIYKQRKKMFFTDNNMEYLLGERFVKNKKYSSKDNKVIDFYFRGNLILKIKTSSIKE